MSQSKRVKVGRNEPCPCGSGRKYKQCCIERGIEWVRNENGEIGRMVPMDDDLMAALEVQRQRFRDHFGRDPEPEDKIFWDAPEPEHLEADLVRSMREIGVHPRLIYAFEKVGRLITEENRHLVPTHDLEMWEAACDEYDRLIGERN